MGVKPLCDSGCINNWRTGNKQSQLLITEKAEVKTFFHVCFTYSCMFEFICLLSYFTHPNCGFLLLSKREINKSVWTHTQHIIAHQSRRCHPSTAHQTHSLPWESAQRAWNHSHHRREGNRKAWEDEDEWLDTNSLCERRHPADVRNFNPSLKGFAAAQSHSLAVWFFI